MGQPPQHASFCSGVNVDESYVIPESDGATCGLVITTAAMVEEGSNDCDGVGNVLLPLRQSSNHVRLL